MLLLFFTITTSKLYSVSILNFLLVSQVVKLLREAYNRVKALLKKVRLLDSHDHTICKTLFLASSSREEVNGSELLPYTPSTKKKKQK